MIAMWTRKLGLAALIALAALAIAECAARKLCPPPEYVRGLVYDPVLGFRSRPDNRKKTNDEEGASDWFTNSRGFLGPELPEEGEPKTGKRLLFLGDSFLHVWNVRLENAMTEVSARLLTESGTPAVAWNVSCNGWGTVQELVALREFGARVQPDVVVLSFYGANDVATNEIELADRTRISTADFLHPYLVVDPADPFAEPALRWSQPVLSFLRRHSRLFETLDLEAQVLANEKGIEWLQYGPSRVPRSERVNLSPVESLEFLYPHPSGHPWDKAWVTTEALITHAAEESRRLGARFLLLVVPNLVQVQRDAGVVAIDVKARRTDPRGIDALFDWNGAETRLARLANERGIEAVFLLGRLREHARAGESAYQSDGHLNTLGQRLAGEAIVEHLRAPAPASDPVPDGRPIDMLGDLPRRLDWRAKGVGSLLDAGWTRWSENALECGPGWAILDEAQAVLRAGAGTLVVRGTLPQAARFPLRVRAEAGGEWRAKVELDRPGPFELRVPVGGTASSEPLLIEIKTTPSFRWGTDPRDFGGVVHELGFEGE
jgi:hypothetical protein